MTPKQLLALDFYRIFAPDGSDLSPEAAEQAMLWETRGGGPKGDGAFSQSNNGFVQGKRWAHRQAEQWRAGIADGVTCTLELYADPKYERFGDLLHGLLNSVQKAGRCFEDDSSPQCSHRKADQPLCR